MECLISYRKKSLSSDPWHYHNDKKKEWSVCKNFTIHQESVEEKENSCEERVYPGVGNCFVWGTWSCVGETCSGNRSQVHWEESCFSSQGTCFAEICFVLAIGFVQAIDCSSETSFFAVI